MDALQELPQQDAQHFEKINPLLIKDKYIPFDKIEPKHFTTALDVLIQTILPQVEVLEAIQNPTWETLFPSLELIEEAIHHVIGPMEHLHLVMDSYEMRLAWAQVEPRIMKINLRLQQSQPLYQAYQTIREKEWETLTPMQKRMLEMRLQAAELAGIGLTGEKKEAFNFAMNKLNQLQTTYNANVLDAIKNFSLVVEDIEQLNGVPSHILQYASEAYNFSKKQDEPLSTPSKGPWKLTLTPHLYLPIMRHCQSRKIREAIFRGQIAKASIGNFDNSENIENQLRLRKQIAHLLGFANYAELSLKRKMAGDVKSVKNFLQDLRAASWEAGQRDLEEIKAFAKASGFHDVLMPWDYTFFAERLKENRFDLSEEDLKAYFPLQKVLNGLFDLCHTLFGVTIERPTEQPPVWHPDVSFFNIFDKHGELIASLYLDPYSRPQSKRGGAWMDNCRNRFLVNDDLQLPIAYVCCNSSPPIEPFPSLLTFREVETLFHEFGHALQHMLTKINHASISGINGIEWDSVEMASQFMENWCYHPATLKKITSHYLTHVPIPDTLIDKLIASRNFQSGTYMLAQIKYGLTDLLLHAEYDPDESGSPFDVWFDVCKHTSHLPCLAEDRFLCSFHHIFGNDDYAAGYYSYKWAEVLSADAFRAFEEADLESDASLSIIGERFKTTFLELGGSLHPMEVFHLFRDRDPSLTPLLEHTGLSE